MGGAKNHYDTNDCDFMQKVLDAVVELGGAERVEAQLRTVDHVVRTREWREWRLLGWLEGAAEALNLTVPELIADARAVTAEVGDGGAEEHEDCKGL